MEAADEDSWSRIYFNFFELSASMDVLENRADKIQDRIVGLISVYNGEETAQSNMNASILNKMAFVFSVILLPFSIVGPIFGAELILDDITSRRSKFLLAMFGAFAAVLGTFLFFVFVQLYSEPDHVRPKWV
jgi:Mg2+ and Co2+ transporter CorA